MTPDLQNDQDLKDSKAKGGKGDTAGFSKRHPPSHDTSGVCHLCTSHGSEEKLGRASQGITG